MSLPDTQPLRAATEQLLAALDGRGPVLASVALRDAVDQLTALAAWADDQPHSLGPGVIDLPAELRSPHDPRCLNARELKLRRQAWSTCRLRRRVVALIDAGVITTCALCGAAGVSLVPDHIVPLARGGTNDADNIQILCEPCNLRKGSHMPGEHPAAGPFVPAGRA
jgi:5-methylcytosine-specific restriction endonuclease McrA